MHFRKDICSFMLLADGIIMLLKCTHVTTMNRLRPILSLIWICNRHYISTICFWFLILSWRRPLSYRNQSIDLLCKSMDWFLYDNDLRHERVKMYVYKHRERYLLDSNMRLTHTCISRGRHSGIVRQLRIARFPVRTLIRSVGPCDPNLLGKCWWPSGQIKQSALTDVYRMSSLLYRQ